jgi:FAD/FMN-containing dehydrogenase
MCGIDLGARGTCTIGGNVATNAGGNQVLRYGMARRNVLGLEVVMADGQIVRSLNKMMKNNAGYDWTQLFIGSEGTLGIITRVVVALHPRSRGIQSALCGVASFADALTILRRLDALMPGRLLVYEAMWREYMNVATGKGGLAQPFEENYELTLLIEAAMGDDPAGADSFSEALASLMDDGSLGAAIIARSESDRRRFWTYREANYEYGRFLPKGSHFDVSIPLTRMTEAVAALRQRVGATWPDAISIVFGHIADSNIHIAVHEPDFDEAVGRAINTVVYAIVAEVGGSVSAEHGIGVLKRSYLPLSRTPPELALMRSIKQTLDPLNILNRGRIMAE